MAKKKAVGSLAELVDAYKPPEDVIELHLDGAAAMRLGRLERRLQEAIVYDRTHNEPDTAPAVRAELEAFQREYDASKVEVRLQALSRKAWSDLMAAHPPSEEHRKLRLDHNPETFWPAALAECIVEPAGSVEDVAMLAERLPEGEWNRLVRCCADLNRGVAGPLDQRLSAILRISAGSSTTSPSEESPGQ